ncbi:hypothetical protein OG21DRAFT_223251 [Imleria badia]|nr:hypothetical protein OG21DRAFT_223251 [Imleria badia]
MLTTTMDHPPRDQTAVRSSPFQARALQFLKKLAQRGRGSGRKSKDTVSPVAIPTQQFQRAHSSVDLLRKPDISPLIGFRVEDGPNPMDTDDSSQASASGNSPLLRPRRHSAWDSLRNAPIHSTFAGHGAAPLFFRDKTGLGNQILVNDPGNLLAPAPFFLRSNTCLDAVVKSARCPGSSPEIPPQINVTLESKPDEAVQDTSSNDMPRPSGDVLSLNDTLTNSSTDPAPSTSADPSILSGGAQSPPAAEESSKAFQKRPALLPRHSAPLPPPFRLTTERGLRLSPSIITRQPMPLLNLPALPPPAAVPDAPQRQKVPLRSIPSLSRHGRNDTECQADDENATPGDSDEDDFDEGDEEEEFMDASSVHQSDDEDDEPPSVGPSGTYGLKSLQKQPMRDDTSLAESPVTLVSPQNDSVGPNAGDYLCPKTYVQSIRPAPSSTSLEMYPYSPNIPNADDDTLRLDPDLPIPRARSEGRPSLYHATSRSMVNLGSTRRAERSLKSREMVGSNPASTSGHTAETHEGSENSDTEAMIGRLLRRTSMPNFHPTSDPPPYPTFNPRPKESHVAAPEDEGREWLPPYSNSLYLLAIMPRKMEFSSPGVQAKDRKWRRVVCELEGTTFRVYKCPPGASGAGVLGDWWEKHVGVGDVAGPSTPRTQKKDSEEQFERPAKLGIDEPPTSVTPPVRSARPTSVPPPRRRTGSQSSMATQSTMISTPRPAKRMSAASFLSPFRASSSTRTETSVGEPLRPESRELELLPVDLQDSHSSLSHELTGRVTPVPRRMSQPLQPRSASRLAFLPTATGRTTWRNGEIPKPSKSDLLRAYTLQHAESGLGNDYLKRKNVIRVRLEGEQFLLQAPDTPAVVEWIEGLHAGTNIALDIDQRLMPRGPMFPRSVVLYCSVGSSAHGGVQAAAAACATHPGTRYWAADTGVIRLALLVDFDITVDLYIASSYVCFLFLFSWNYKKGSVYFPTIFAVCHVRFLPLAIVASNELLRYLVSVLSSIFLFNGFSPFSWFWQPTKAIAQAFPSPYFLVKIRHSTAVKDQRYCLPLVFSTNNIRTSLLHANV